MTGYLRPQGPSSKASSAAWPGLGGAGAVDLLQRRGDRLAVLLGDEGRASCG